MSEVEALPFVQALAASERPADRAVFLRVCHDLKAQGRPFSPGWTAALQACLARASAEERAAFLAGLAAPGEPTREAVQAILDEGRLERLLALACDPLTRLRADHLAALVPHARAAARSGDARLAKAVLAREPIRLEAAPLFLEAAPDQRRALLLAATRAELGRRATPAPRLDAEAAERLEFAAIAGDGHDFARALGEALGVDDQLSRLIAADPDGEPLAVALAALGAPQDLSVRILTGRDLSEGGGFQRVHALARLGDRLSPAAARRIMAAVAGQGAPPPRAAPVAAPRQAAEPSPFLRRETFSRRAAVNPETSAKSARNTRAP